MSCDVCFKKIEIVRPHMPTVILFKPSAPLLDLSFYRMLLFPAKLERLVSCVYVTGFATEVILVLGIYSQE